MVISTIGMPPLVTVSAAKWASSAEETRIAGMMPILLMSSQTSCLFHSSKRPSVSERSLQAGAEC